MVVSSFGKKRLVKKNSVSSKVMYAVKRTKSGRRVVHVIEVKKGRKIVKVYKSTNRDIPKSAVVHKTKTLASKHLKATSKTALKKSGFGSAPGRLSAGRKSIKTVLPYGYAACRDHEKEAEMGDGLPRFRVYKFHPIKLGYEKKRVIIHKEKFGETKVYILGEDSKGYMVKTKGTKSQEVASASVARHKAKLQAQKLRIGKFSGMDLGLQLCTPGIVGELAESNSGSTVGSKLAALVHNGARQVRDVSRINDIRNILDQSGRGLNTGRLMLPGGGGMFPLRRTDYDPRSVKMVTTDATGNRINAATQSAFPGLQIPTNKFGRRLNYGFSRFF